MNFPTYRTTVSNCDGATRVVFHRTTVVGFDSDTITLNSDGWQTVTTKRRMNQASEYYGLEFQVYQKDFIWYVLWKGETLEYYDGMTLNRHRLHADWVKVERAIGSPACGERAAASNELTEQRGPV